MLSPVIGNWYQNIANESFEVVACDFDDGTIEIQYFDGTVEELDLESWEELVVCDIAPPEDWSGPMDLDRPDRTTDVDIEVDGSETWNRILDQ